MTLSPSWSSQPVFPGAPGSQQFYPPPHRGEQGKVQVWGGPWSNSARARNGQGDLRTSFCRTSPNDPIASLSYIILTTITKH